VHTIGSLKILMAYFINPMKNKRSENTVLANAPPPSTDLRNSTAFWKVFRLPPFLILVRTACARRWKWVCSGGRTIATRENRITWRRECSNESQLLLKTPSRPRRNHSLFIRKEDRLISFRERIFFLLWVPYETNEFSQCAECSIS
jgi:hypothetical protein